MKEKGKVNQLDVANLFFLCKEIFGFCSFATAVCISCDCIFLNILLLFYLRRSSLLSTRNVGHFVLLLLVFYHFAKCWSFFSPCCFYLSFGLLLPLFCWSFLFPTSSWFTLPFSFSLVYSRYPSVPVLRSLMCFFVLVRLVHH